VNIGINREAARFERNTQVVMGWVAGRRIPRHHEVLAEILRTDDSERAEALVLHLVRAPQNRAEARTLAKGMSKPVRRALGYGWNRNKPLVTR
jgi:hypothetical protein